MTHLTAATRVLHRLRREVDRLGAAQELIWDRWGRIDPSPDPYLHWEPSTSGWRLYGTLPPPDPGAPGPP